MLQALDAALRDRSELSASTDPKLRMHLVIWHNLALEDVSVKQIVVHGLCHDLRN